MMELIRIPVTQTLPVVFIRPWMHPFGLGFFGILGAILLFLLPILLVMGIIDLLFSDSNPSQNQKENSYSLEVLKERYAKGEIDKEEFEKKKRDLSN